MSTGKLVSIGEIRVHDHLIHSIRMIGRYMEVVTGLEDGPPVYIFHFEWPVHFCLHQPTHPELGFVGLAPDHPVLARVLAEIHDEEKAHADAVGDPEDSIELPDLYCIVFSEDREMVYTQLTVVCEQYRITQVSDQFRPGRPIE